MESLINIDLESDKPQGELLQGIAWGLQNRDLRVTEFYFLTQVSWFSGLAHSSPFSWASLRNRIASLL